MPTEVMQPAGFSCTQCGECCRNLSGLGRAVLLTPADIRRIDAHIAVHPELDGISYVHDEPIAGAPAGLRRIKGRENGDCPFLAADNLCAIHAVKPHQCRHTPYQFFWPELGWQHSCGDGVIVPDGWTSKTADDSFIAALVDEGDT